MDDSLPEPVRDWKLETTVCDGYTLQTRHVSNQATGLWRTPVQERWQRTKKLGQGGFGVVWLEQCTEGMSTGRVRAVKEIHTSFGNQTMTPKMLSSELSAIIKFSQKPYRDCFVRSFGWYDSPGCIFITMEYLPLGDLEEHISERLPEAQAQRITLQVLQGLAFMHQSKFAHRDLKPRNALVQHQGPDWWVKISDFGTSKQVGTTVLRTVIGTEHYQAPEVRGIYRLCDVDEDEDDSDPSYDLAIDIWAVGAMAFRMTTGRVPFPGTKDLTRYVLRDDSFPADGSLSEAYATFINETMRASARDRPTAKKALESPWIREHLPGPQGPGLRSDAAAGLPGSWLQNGYEASAKWSTSTGLSDLLDDNSNTLRQHGPSLESRNGESSKTSRRELVDDSVSVLATESLDTMRRDPITYQDTGSSVTTEQTARKFSRSLVSEFPPTSRRSRAHVDSELKSVQLLEGFESVVSKVAFSKSSKWLATVCSSHIHIWSVDNLGTVTFRQSLLGHPGLSVHSLSFRDGDHHLLAVVSQQGGEWVMRRWQVDRQQEFQLLQSVPVHCPKYEGDIPAVLSQNGLFFAVLLPINAQKKLINIYRTKPDGQLEVRKSYFTDNNGGFCNMILSDDGLRLIEGDSLECYIWNFNGTTATRHKLFLECNNFTWPMTLSATGGQLLSYTRPHLAIVGLQLETLLRIEQRLEHKNLKTRLSHGAFSPDGRMIAGADKNGQIFLWEKNEMGIFLPKETLKGHEKEVSAIVFSPDGRWLLAASREKTSIIWDVSVR